jgi:hypothetical protein
VFRSHRMYDPLEPGTDYSIDVEVLNRALVEP